MKCNIYFILSHMALFDNSIILPLLPFETIGFMVSVFFYILNNMITLFYKSTTIFDRLFNSLNFWFLFSFHHTIDWYFSSDYKVSIKPRIFNISIDSSSLNIFSSLFLYLLQIIEKSNVFSKIYILDFLNFLYLRQITQYNFF